MARVLVVDSNALDRDRIRSLLHRGNHEVLEASDGEDGLAMAEARRPDLVLTEFVLPKLNGFQLCTALRAIDNLRELRIVLVAPEAGKVGEQFKTRFGASDAISKPFADTAFLAVIEHVLGRERAEPSSGGISVGPAREGQEQPEIAGTDLEGSLAVVPLGEVMQLLALQRQTGVLTVRAERAEVELLLGAGRIDFARARGVRTEFLLGRYLVSEELISRDELELILRNRRSTLPLGAQLVKLGYLSQEELNRALARQTAGIVVEALRWNHGRFVFDQGRSLPEAGEHRAQLTVADLVLEGLRQVDEWRLIEHELPGPETVLERNDAQAGLFSADSLGIEETLVLTLVDGRRTVGEIVDRSDMSSFNAYKNLYRLLSLKLVRRVGTP